MLSKFTVYGEPKGKARPVVTKHGTFTPKTTAYYENLVKVGYTMEGCERFPDDAQLKANIVAYYGIPKSASKKKKEQMLAGFIRPTKKPDLDNIEKVICDSLNNIAYRDDSQIVEITCAKYYSETPRVEVSITDI